VTGTTRWSDKWLAQFNKGNFMNYLNFSPEDFNGALRGVSVVMSGFRHEGLKQEITALGGQVKNAVSKGTTHVLVSSKKLATTKVQAAKRNGAKIMTAKQFKNFMDKAIGQHVVDLLEYKRGFYVNLQFSMERWPSYDEEQALDRIAKKHNGFLSGTGSDFSSRDVGFVFDYEQDAEAFVKAARKAKFVFKPQIYDNSENG
jgi:hypothetical protein